MTSTRTVDGDGCSERPFVLDTARGRIAGVLCEPASDSARSDWVVFLNAGRVRRIGPNRIATEYSREWARRGLPCLRVDLGGIGDSYGELADDERFAEYDAAWYDNPSFVQDSTDALDWLQAECGASRFALTGLCSGASWGFAVAHRDARVSGVTLLNPRLLFTDRRATALDAWIEARRLARHPGSWRDLRGRGLRSLPRAAAKGAALTLTGKGERGWQREQIVTALADLRARGVKLGIVFSAGDLGIGYFERHLGTHYQRELDDLGVTVRIIRGPDHTFRPLWSHELVRREIERNLGAIGLLDSEENEARAG